MIKIQNKEIRGAVIVACIGLAYFMGLVTGYYKGTGSLIFMPAESIYTPPITSSENITVVKNFLASDNTSLNRYDIGFNCVEYALLLSRDAQWKGIPAEPIRLLFSDDTAHIIVAFPVASQWLFVEPQNKEFISPVVGGEYFGSKIVEIDKLDAEWVPLEIK